MCVIKVFHEFGHKVHGRQKEDNRISVERNRGSGWIERYGDIVVRSANCDADVVNAVSHMVENCLPGGQDVRRR